MTSPRLTKRQRERRESVLQFYKTFTCIECGCAGVDMLSDQDPQRYSRRNCLCGAWYDADIGAPHFPNSFEVSFDFRVGRREWHFTYDSKWDESDFLCLTDDELREHQQKGYLSPKRFVKLFAFL